MATPCPEFKSPEVAKPIEGFVWIGPQGQWLTYYENSTHTGTHKVLGETNDLSKAYVGAFLPATMNRAGLK